LIQSLPWEKATVNWDLRIAQDAGNIFSSLDGTIFVDQTLAQFLGSQAGLWAAALSHEITHVVRRDWARRYTLQESVEDDRASQIVLGTVAVSSGAWVDPRGSSAWIASCNRLMELEADAGSLTLMAKAGFHPDFVPPLHQALEAQPVQLRQDLRDPSHPRWDVRDEKLQKLLVATSKEYDRMRPARYASPGGNPPVVVYAGAPAAKTLSEGDTQVLIPLNCQNLAGSVEVVLQLNENKDLCRTRHAADGLHIETNLDHLPDTPVRQPEGSLSSTRGSFDFERSRRRADVYSCSDFRALRR
jgi:hypothetical protein